MESIVPDLAESWAWSSDGKILTFKLLLFPGRHLVNTRFQEDYLKRILSTKPIELSGFMPGCAELNAPPSEIIFAITSGNQENSRFNPIPFHVRAMGVDRFAETCDRACLFVSVYSASRIMATRRTLPSSQSKEIAYQSEQAIKFDAGQLPGALSPLPK